MALPSFVSVAPAAWVVRGRHGKAPRCCAQNGNGNGHGNGKGDTAGNGTAGGVRKVPGESGNGSKQFVIGHAVEKLKWCSAKTEVHEGTLASTVLEDIEEDQVCDVDVENCQERLQPRSMTPHFVDTFRMSSVYINVFRNTVFVIHIPGAIADEPLYESVMADIALLNVVGVKLVLVLGPRRQIERRIRESHIEERFVNGVRVTDAAMLQLIKEATGALLFEIESKLSRGVVNVPTRNKISVVSGNFYTAQPIGVIDGADLGFTGKVRRIDVEAITRRLDQGDIVLLSNIAYSPSGESFNCQSESVASICAAQLKAEKLIYLGGHEVLFDTTTNSMVPNLPLPTANEFLAVHSDLLPQTFRLRLKECTSALAAGVRRAHVLNRFVDGVLIMEIFHRDGVGIMISRDIYEGVRPAQLADLPGIFEIVEPLMQSKVLVPRSRDQLEHDIGNMVVAERDGMILGLALLATFDDDRTVGELACFAVHPRYRKSGKGGSLLLYVERVAYAMGIRTLFILSTQSFAWFRERKFEEVDLSKLPQSRQKRYNHARNSKVLMKSLLPTDELEELLISVQDEHS